MLGQKKQTIPEKASAWLMRHNAIACTSICLGTAVALISLFLFVVFSGFGASADFIYNQF